MTKEKEGYCISSIYMKEQENNNSRHFHHTNKGIQIDRDDLERKGNN